MATQLTITIPDDLAEKLEYFKASVIPSNVCRDALLAAVSEREEIRQHMTHGEPIRNVVERMRGERLALGVSYYKDGVKAGIKWGKGRRYQDLKAAVILLCRFPDPHELWDDLAKTPCAISEAFHRASRVYDNDRRVPLFEEEIEEPTAEGLAWLHGFSDGVIETWEQIQPS